MHWKSFSRRTTLFAVYVLRDALPTVVTRLARPAGLSIPSP